ncbi:MAG: sulfotransferase family protein [Alphaproteobacteria bacterium]|nr:MAG: sulfotransferase family protein [Alphaproteobacteria bacterium]
MAFPGVWMTESERLVYRVVPKCACSTIGQAMYFADHGRFFDGDIHDADSGILKWAQEDAQPRIAARVRGCDAVTFTCVRNPYTRILSCFFDKICGIQRNGRRYRANQLPGLLRRYGVVIEGEDFDQIAMFRRFLLFARDTIRFRKPMEPDIHWSSCAGHVSTLVAGGGRYDRILATEALGPGLQEVLDSAGLAHRVDVAAMPRFNESEGHGPRRAHPVEAYFDDLSIHLMHEIYRRDFNLFKYDKNPGSGPPVKEIDLDELHARLSS